MVAYKCPRDNGVDKYNPEDVLKPGELIDHYKGIGFPLTHVIDLTNTDRYYDRGQFSANYGIHHFKFSLPGREIPCQNYLDRFTNLLNTLKLSRK